MMREMSHFKIQFSLFSSIYLENFSSQKVAQKVELSSEK